ncbi:MAG: LssY C-terminal domain-containing protein [Bryobacteraceae bacterium]
MPATSRWVDTGIDVAAGDSITFSATGTVQLGGKSIDPDGGGRGFSDLIKVYPLNDANKGAVLGRIGSEAASRPFLIGSRRESKAPISGRLFLGVNLGGNDIGTGSFKVTLDRKAASAASRAPEAKITPLAQHLLDTLPARVSDPDGAAGDRVNFLIVGTLVQVQTAFRNAGWVTVDRTVKDTVMRGIFATFSKQAYVTIPMSELQLFGRPQDFGYAQADPVRVVASRHHFRLWKAPFTNDGATVWVGAGTHDIGFDRDQRNGKLTHKIDPDVDGEREYIGQSLQQTGMVAKLDYMVPKETIKEAKTAHGEAFNSDGRTLIVYMRPDETHQVAAFADTFCSVLAQSNPDGGEWGNCDQYLDTAGRADAKLPELSKNYRVLVIPGFMSSCFSDAPAFEQGLIDLKDKHGMTVDRIDMPNDSSEDNAKKIGDFIREARKTDSRKFILVGYSKGTPDAQVALAQEAGVRDAVAAFISVAGASGGSAIADTLPGIVDQWIRRYSLPGCKGDIPAGFRSLRRDVRRAFLASYPDPLVPSYSLIAVADENLVSKMLAQTWKILRAFDLVEDGQLTKLDAIVPGSNFLGAARGDHFAVALPFEKSASMKNMVDKGHYPRAALLESLIRFVTQDLTAAPK